MSIEKYMQDMKTLIFNQDNTTLNLFEKLYTETEKHRITVITDSGYDSKCIKGEFGKSDFLRLHRITGVYSKLVYKESLRKDVCTIVKYKDVFFVFDKKYSQNLQQTITLKKTVNKPFITVYELMSKVQEHVPEEKSWSKFGYAELLY